MTYQDLLKDTSAQSADPGYFIVTITDLDPLTLYPLQFRWKYNDNSFGPWSAVKAITTPAELTPDTPELGPTDVVGGQGFIKITWSGNNDSGQPISNIDRVNIHISGGTFGIGTSVVDFFKTAGTKTIVAAPGDYIVQLKAVTVAGSDSFYSLSRTVTVTGAEDTVTPPEDPSAPTLSAGKASVIVNWDGKNSSSSDFTAGSFYGAKIYIGTTSSFIPSDNNWVHTLNFANGENKVSIGVGTIIDKSTSDLLNFDTEYYIKLGTLNRNGETTGNFVSALNNPITVARTAFSEIEAGILAADAYIQAGADGGQRVVISGGQEPFVIYGSDGITKLLEFDTVVGGAGALSIIGSGSFSGDISAATGTLSNALNIGTPSGGLYPFSVSSTGVVRAISGTVGGLTLAADGIQNSTGSFKLDSDGKARFGIGSNRIEIDPSIGISHAGGNFTLGINGTLSLTGSVTATAGSIANWLISGSTLTANNLTLDASTGTIFSGNSAGSHIQLSNANGLRHMNNASTTGNFVLTPTGDLTIRGTVTAVSGYIGTPESGWYIDSVGIRNSQYGVTPNTFLYNPNTFSDSNVIFQIADTEKFSVTKAGNLTASNADISGTIRGSEVIGSTFWIGANANSTDYINWDGTFSLGSGAITYNGSEFRINGTGLPYSQFKIGLSVTSDENGTFGDSTVVQNSAGYLTTGRAFYYGGNNYPDGAVSRSTTQDPTGRPFVTGDIWLSRKA